LHLVWLTLANCRHLPKVSLALLSGFGCPHACHQDPVPLQLAFQVHVREAGWRIWEGGEDLLFQISWECLERGREQTLEEESFHPWPVSGGTKAKDSVGTVAEKTTGAMGNIAAATGLVKKDEFPTDMNPEEYGQEAMEGQGETMLEAEGESYDDSQQESQDYEPEA
uniref:Synuclein, beta n=1 Tax=Myripristis murdjan TaxID=586833 RepID=A0A668AGI6_9TELE